MTADLKIVEEPKKPMSMNPHKFSLWLFMVTIGMIFAAFTSAYIVRQAEGDWLDFALPMEMWISSGIILISSITMHWALLSAKRDNLEQIKVAMLATTILGVGFLFSQWYSWKALTETSVFWVGNPAGSFVYVFSGVHGVHIISGLVFLLIVLGSTYKYKVHSKNLNQIQMCASFWHFLDALWIYLFLFLLFYR